MPSVSHDAVQVQGARRLRQTLQRAGISLEDLKAAHREAGGIVSRRSKVTAPVSNNDGRHIRDTIRVGATKTAAIIRAGGKALPYGNPIHWGWYARHIKPQPWVSYAAQDTETQWTDLYWSAVETIMSKIEGA